MAKNEGVIGIYTAHGRLSMSMIRGKEKKTAWVDIPDNIVHNGEILSKNLLAAFIRDSMKEMGFKAKKAAFVIREDNSLIREVNIPKMTDEQIRVNLPYEFRDYIRGELKDYVFDYAHRNMGEENVSEDGNTSMELLAVAIPVDYYNTLTEIMTTAGLKLVKAVPEIYVLENYLKQFESEEEQKVERCFLDIGNRNTRMQVLKNGKYKLSHLIDIGENHIVQAVADDMNVDTELARTYLRTKYEGCDRHDAVVNAYKDISVEVLKGLNFYEMSDMSSRLNEVVIYGGGAMIEPLVELLKERISMNVCTIDEAFPKFGMDREFGITAASLGALFDDDTASQDKAYINFAEVKKKKKTNLGLVFAGILAACLAIVLFAKFAVIDRFNDMYRAQSDNAELQNQLNQNLKAINEASDLNEEFYHYTWTDMDEEEKTRIRRLDATKVVKSIGSSDITVNSFSVEENIITADITTDSLKRISELSETLSAEESIENVTVSTAQKVEKQKTITTGNDDGNDAGITIQKRKVVQAKIKIFMKGLEVEDADVEELSQNN